MGHWEQIGAENQRATPTPRWKRVAVGIFAVVASLILWLLLLSPIWRMWL